jgi:hypothetical protein
MESNGACLSCPLFQSHPHVYLLAVHACVYVSLFYMWTQQRREKKREGEQGETESKERQRGRERERESERDIGRRMHDGEIAVWS